MAQYGLKNREPAFQAAGYKITPDEIDRYEVYDVIFPSAAGTPGTAAAGTSTQAKALVFDNVYADYPRNITGAVTGTSDMGGVFVVNGKDQFGENVTETITVATAANGGTTDGTMIFAKFTSGTLTFATGAVGNGTARLVYATAEGTPRFGLPFRIGGTADVKSISWKNNFVTKAINGGTIGAYVGAGGFEGYKNYFKGTAALGTADVFHVVAKTTYNADSDTRPQAGL
jgi:hypothetical protein